jgi:hypothetical protein
MSASYASETALLEYAGIWADGWRMHATNAINRI